MTKMNRIKMVLLVLLFVPAFIMQAQSKLDKKVLMTIAGDEVTVKEFMDVYNKNNVDNQMIDKKSLDEYLDLYINFRLKVKEAENLKMDTASGFVKELAGYRKQLAKPYFTNEKVSEELLEEAYNRKLSDVRASHILIKLDKDAAPKDTLTAYNKAIAARNRILAGEDFGTVAAELSDDPSARDREEIPGKQAFRQGNKGDLGYFSVFDMVYPFENGAYNTPVGEISMPIRSDFGYHLIKVEERSPAIGTMEVAHIYVSVKPDATEEEMTEKQEKINKIYEEIQNGMSFEEAVKAYSEDRGSAQRDGKLSKFTVNRIVPEFVETIKKMDIGQISEPIHTMYGYHIIKFLGTEKPGSFEEESPKLKERLAKDSRANKSEEAVLKQIQKDAKFKSYDKNLSAFVASLDSNFTKGVFEPAASQANSNPLFKLGKKVYTVDEFSKYIKSKITKQENNDAAAYAYKLYKDFVKQSSLDYEDSILETKYPEFARLMKEYRDGILLFDLMDKQVWSKAVKDSVGLAQFHEQNKNNYMWKERAEAVMFTVTKSEDLPRFEKILAETHDDMKVAELLKRDTIRSVQIRKGMFEKGDNNNVDLTEWKLGLSGPLKSNVDKNTMFINVLRIVEPEPKKLDEARGLITSDYQNYLEKQWVNELRKKYPVEVNTAVFEKVKASY